MFSESREKASTDHLKASTSELLMAFPLVRHFAVTLVQPLGKLSAECRSLLALCALVDAFLAAKHGRAADAARWTSEFLEAHKDN